MRVLITTMALLLLISLPALADKQQVAPYDSALLYEGIYKQDRLYQFNERGQLWYGAKRPIAWASVVCGKARNALQFEGEWVGNFSDIGECLGQAEAPRWANGNYLNYLKSLKSQSY